VKFNLIDKIELLTDERIVAFKQVTLAEEYLADHFPTFPVLPGVLMLEALVQAAAWLLHRRNDFSRSMAVLKDARNVKYGQFVAPGNSFRIDVQCVRATPDGGSFKATGTVGDKTAPTAGQNTPQNVAVSARLELVYFNLSSKQPDPSGELAATDRRLIEHNRSRWALIDPSRSTAAPEAPQTVTI
jgi:3-hydroxyacyl-[acyl-carrier-protein] dehydratase